MPSSHERVAWARILAELATAVTPSYIDRSFAGKLQLHLRNVHENGGARWPLGVELRGCPLFLTSRAQL